MATNKNIPLVNMPPNYIFNSYNEEFKMILLTFERKTYLKNPILIGTANQIIMISKFIEKHGFTEAASRFLRTMI